MRGKRMYLKVLLAVMLAAALALGGCSDGKDGRDGAPGAPGAPGEPAAPGTVTPTSAVESCIICHDSGTNGVEEVHAVTGQFGFSNTSVEVDPIDVNSLRVTFDLTVDGVPTDAYAATTPWPNSGGPTRAVVMYFDPIDNVYKRQTFDRTANYDTTVAVLNGSYTLTIARSAAGVTAGVTLPAFFATPGIDARWYFRLGAPAAAGLRNISVSFEDAAYDRLDLVNNDSCIACHGDILTDGISDSGTRNFANHHNNPFRVEACITCHAPENHVGRTVENGVVTSSRGKLDRVIHGIHNSASMPDGTYVFDANYSWTDVTYPTYMLNCSVCHVSDNAVESLAILDAVNAMTVTGPNCFSCHGDITSPSFDFSQLTFHSNYNETTTCQDCHKAGGIARATVAEYHDGSTTGRGGLIYKGQDISVVEGDKVEMTITGVSKPDITGVIDITWTATYNNIAVNPCNAAVAANAPIFHAGGAASTVTGQANSNFSFLRAYGIGDDWNNDLIGSAPGQPVATSVTALNTSCAANVATTSIQLTAVELETQLTRGIVALQGKPQVKLPYKYDAQKDVIQVRAFTPTYEFDVATGAAAAPRRDVIDVASCLSCHVGSMYQHGGNRVDNPQMCVMCHNESSNEQNVREDFYGIDASFAYDGKAGETFGLKTMLHAIHSAGANGGPYVLYRSRGIYAFGNDPADLNNWPGTGSQTVSGSTRSQNHNFITPTYPRYLNDCTACHAAGFDSIPDQSIALATTLEAGAEPWNNTFDDVLRGPAAAACLSCHQDENSFKRAVVKDHVYRNGWFPTTFEEGAKTILDAAQ